MANEVYMDIPAVRNMSREFSRIGELLDKVNKVLEGLMMLLRSTAFIGAVGGLAVLHFIEMIKPYIANMAKKCTEIGHDLELSVAAYERGDAQGATRFY